MNRAPSSLRALLLGLAAPARAQFLGTPEALDFFGDVVATGDFNGDGATTSPSGGFTQTRRVTLLR